MKLEINQTILDVLRKYIYDSVNNKQEEIEITAEGLFLQMQAGDCSKPKSSKICAFTLSESIYILLQILKINEWRTLWSGLLLRIFL